MSNTNSTKLFSLKVRIIGTLMSCPQCRGCCVCHGTGATAPRSSSSFDERRTKGSKIRQLARQRIIRSFHGTTFKQLESVAVGAFLCQRSHGGGSPQRGKVLVLLWWWWCRGRKSLFDHKRHFLGPVHPTRATRGRKLGRVVVVVMMMMRQEERPLQVHHGGIRHCQRRQHGAVGVRIPRKGRLV